MRIKSLTKKILSIATAGLMLSMVAFPLTALADDPTTSTEDVTAPTFTSISISPTSGETPASFTVTISGISDDISGVDSGEIIFRDSTSDKTVSGYFYTNYSDTNFSYENGTAIMTVTVDQYKPSGTYVISSVSLSDKAGNYKTWNGQGYRWYADSENKLPGSLSDISYAVVNNGATPSVVTSTSSIKYFK